MARHRGSGRAYPGRHRYGLPGLIHCLHLPAVQLRLSWRLTGWLPTRHDLAGAGRRIPATAPAARPVSATTQAPAVRAVPTGSATAEWARPGGRLAA